MSESFTPANRLEELMADAHRGRTSTAEFLSAVREACSQSGSNLLDTMQRALEVSLEVDADVEIRPFEQSGVVNVVVTGKK